MPVRTIFGTIRENGSIISGSGGYSVAREESGNYTITFDPAFADVPTIVGSQSGYGTPEDSLDNVVFPNLSSTSATVFTGDDNGAHTDRQFCFIVMGE